MVVKVVDASALAALLFDEPEADAIADRLVGDLLVAPTLLDFELANVCLIKGRRQPQLGDALAAAYRLRRRFGVESAVVDHEGVLDLARVTGLTAYDASYLWLARQLGAELVTLDRQLEAAAQLGVE